MPPLAAIPAALAAAGTAAETGAAGLGSSLMSGLGSLGSTLGLTGAAAPAAGAAGNAAMMAPLGMGPAFESAMAGGITPAMAGTGTVGGGGLMGNIGNIMAMNKMLGNPLQSMLGGGQAQQQPQPMPLPPASPGGQSQPFHLLGPYQKPQAPMRMGQIPLY